MKPISLAPLDYGIIALFIAGILALGFSARLRESSVLQFIAAGRRLTLPVFVATLVSTWYGGILGISESVSYYGLGTWLLLGVPYYIFALLYAFFFARRVRGAEEISIPERLHSRFGRTAGMLGAGLIFMLAVPAAHVLMLGILTRALSGWDWPISLCLGALIGCLFLYRGGLLADARVSMLAFVMMYVGFGAIVVYCLTAVPPAEIIAKAQPAQATLTGGQGPLFILSFFLLGAWTLVDPGFHQRVASANSEATSKKGVLISVVFWALFDILSITAAMYALHLLPPLGAEATSLDRLAIYPNFADQVLPAGLKAIFLCGIFGTVLSAMVGYTLVSGATFGRELVGRASTNLSESQMMGWCRVGLFVAAALAIVLAASMESVVALWYSWAGAVIGALLVPVCIAYGIFRSKAAQSSIALSIAVAFAVTLSWLVYGVTSGNPYLEVTWLGEKFSLGTLIPGVVVSSLIIGAGGIMRRTR